MQLEVPNLMETSLQSQMEEDLRRLLAGTDIRADGTFISPDSLDMNIKNLFAMGPVEPKKSENFEPTKSGVNSSQQQEIRGGGGNEQKAPVKNNPDVALPKGLQKLTGAKTVGQFLGNGVTTVVGGALTAVNPIAGLAFKGLVSTLHGVNPLDAAANVAVSLNPFSAIGVKALGAIGAYDKAEGLATSAADAYQTINNINHVPTTLAGRNVINAQVEAAKAATGHYDSSRNEQQRASTAALNKDNAPAYARPGYGDSLANAKNPAKSTAKPSDSSKNGSYKSAGGITKTDSSKGHAPAGGVGPSPSKGSSSSSSSSNKGNSGGSNKGSSSGSGSSKGSSSSSSGGSKGNGKTGSGGYGGK